MIEKPSPRAELSEMFTERKELSDKINAKIDEILQSEYAGKSDEVKDTILRIHEKICNLQFI